MYSERPYITGTISYNPFLQTPIRDTVVCDSGPAESHVIPIAGGGAYLDLIALSMQLIILAVLFLVLPIVDLHKRFATKGDIIFSFSLGVLYCLFLILATVNHIGKEVVIPIFAVSTIFLLAVGLLVFKKLNALVR